MIEASHNWIQTRSGIRFELDHPVVSMVKLSDIANSLFRQARFNGQSDTLWTVGQHSLCVAELARRHSKAENSGRANPQVVLQALLHDSAEAYIGDIVSPFKKMLTNIIPLEERILKTIFVAFDLPITFPLIHHTVEFCDKVICSTEAQHLFDHAPIDGWNLRLAEPLSKDILYDFANSSPQDFIYEVHKWHDLSSLDKLERANMMDKSC